jgi:hypothetical protein
MVVEAAGHADDRRLIAAEILPAVVSAGRNDDQAPIALTQREFVRATETERFAASVIADDAKRTG